MPRLILVPALLTLWLAALPARADDPAGAEFFEKAVRPLLAERCQKCHGAEKAKGNLRLDSRAAMLEGGGNGPSVVPGKPAESLLIDAINYGDLVQMPPKSKLDAAEIATLTKWVELGAPWPGGDTPKAAIAAKGFDLGERAKHWSFQPVRRAEPPSVVAGDWPSNPIDRFLLAALEAKGLKPAPDADKRTLLRRVTFDLIGLPPTPVEVDAFLADEAPDALEKVVERLLASPHYGERWGRHWLDLVRFAETAGHEFDYNLNGASMYRDYVIRAFNADVPYNQFVVEHVAGDLLESPRRHPTDGTDESILGTGFFLLVEGTHSPVDVREEAARRVDNQIDVLSKTFLGLTVACARCHDHKFDAISTKDYYALAGYLHSSRHQMAFLDPPDRIGARIAELEAIKAEGKARLAASKFSGGTKVAAYLLAAREVLHAAEPTARQIAATRGLDEATLARWVKALQEDGVRSPSHPLAAWALTGDRPAAKPPRDTSLLFEDFENGTYEGWYVTGDAFGKGPTGTGEWIVRRDGERRFTSTVAPGVAHSGRVSDRLQGVLRSKTTPIRHRYIHYLAAGRQGRINVVVDGFEKIRDPIYGPLTFSVDAGDAPRWYTQDVGMWVGHDAYIEIADGASVRFESQALLNSGEGYVAVDEIRFSDDPTPPARPSAFADALLAGAAAPELLASRYEQAIDEAMELWRAGKLGDDRAAVLGGLADRGLIRLDGGSASESPLEEWLARYGRAEAAIPAPSLAPALADGTGEDEHVAIRGSYKTPGDLVPRRFLEAIAGADQPAPASGSGRLELARRMVDPANPLTARVMVNRLWKHHFGEGLVRSTDDFGVMGRAPTHPELLDFLATEFLRRGSSIKQMHRLLVLSHAYRMESRAEPSADLADPDNRLWHRRNVQRLEAEALRDAILSASGRLDLTMFGPSVPTHLTPFMEGRGRPGSSGPLDGAGRRSLYLNVRRNFLNPMLLAFDFPTPATTIGRRNVSNVPAQSLTLLNDPFVIGQARLWADRVLKEEGKTPGDRVVGLYQTAYGRPPTDRERADALAFLDDQAKLYGTPGDPRAWADLCHVLLNVKEFLYVN